MLRTLKFSPYDKLRISNPSNSSLIIGNNSLTCPSFVAEAVGAETVTWARSQASATIALLVKRHGASSEYQFQRCDLKIRDEATRVEDFELEHCVRS